MATHDLVYKDESFRIVGAAMAVHQELGCGFLEAVYAEAFELELESRGIPFQREAKLSIVYKGTVLNKRYEADFICYDKVIVELKALQMLESSHEAQVLNYLKASGLKLGILINFGAPSLQTKRLVL